METWTPYRENLEKTITIPDSDGLTMVIRKIGKSGLEKASFVLQKAALAKMKDLGGAEMFASMRSMTGKAIATQEEAEAIANKAVERDPLLAYDTATLIKLGTKTMPDGINLDDQDFNAFQPAFVDWLVREIYTLEMEDAPKKG